MINIQQEPTAFYPAYNDSYLNFSTTFTENDRAVVVLDGSYQFTVFPDPQGNYIFNMREIVKALINSTQFRDNLNSSVSGWGFSDSSLYKEITVDITAYGDDTSESLSKVYSFNKAVKQFGDKLLLNPYQLMLPSKDGINYSLTYFEGYPMEIPFRYLNTTDSITLYNQRTEQVSTAFVPSVNSPYRLFIDKGMTNWHSAGVLELPDMMSRLDIRAAGVTKATIELTKKADMCGKYLKFFNADGSYSYWLFHQWFKQTHTGGEIDRVSTNNYSNVFGNSEGLTKVSGKAGSNTMRLKTAVTEAEKNHIISLFTSPLVQMWSADEPYQDGKWLDIKVISRGFTYANKKTHNQIEVEIELPEVITQIL